MHLSHLPHLLLVLAQAAPAKAVHMGVLKRLGERLMHLGGTGLAVASLFDLGVDSHTVAADPDPTGQHPSPQISDLPPDRRACVGRGQHGAVLRWAVLGGELFLLGKINRERYERLRDRFEEQEFFAILIPAMGPPPTPFKLFEFCAGVFEMKPVTFFFAAFLGKLVQFTVYATLTYFYGPAVVDLLFHTVRAHAHLVLFVVGLMLIFLAIWVVRKIFDRKRGTRFPIEDTSVESAGTAIVDE